MKKTYVTTMPDHAGAFLKATKCFSDLEMNITRVSYNKAVDMHTLFIEAEGSREKLAVATEMLEKIGYISDKGQGMNVILVEFKLDDKPGELLRVLSLISKYSFNISYISSHENGLGFQPFKMGLFVEDENAFASFISEAGELCPVSVIEYDHTEVNFDNSIFYQNYVDKLAEDAALSDELKNKLKVNVNRAMQILDERNLSPKTTFDFIGKFASLLKEAKGDGFKAEINEYAITENSSVTVIEPPCGSNVIVLKSGDGFLFIDSGYSLYKDETLSIFDEITGGFDKIKKRILLTHADVDHSGLLYLFDEIYASDKSKECLTLEYEGKRGFREQNPLHLPYVRICKLLTAHTLPDPEKITVIARCNNEAEEPVYRTSDFKFGEFELEVYCGMGGHLPGETVLIDRRHRLIFTGDIYVNLHGYNPRQAEYNKYAPVLMTSVDTNPELAKLERNALFKIMGEGSWQIFSGHGCRKVIGERH